MIIIDSSVWIDFLNGHSTLQTDLLKHVRTRSRLGTPDLVLAEVLQGARSERAANETERLLRITEIVDVCGDAVAVAAARNYRSLRARGLTPRKTIDTLIASYCIEADLPLLYADRDFDGFVQHLGLRAAADFIPKVY